MSFENYSLTCQSGSDENRVISSRKIGDILFGRYKIERLIGKGAFSEIYEVSDLFSKQHFAIKIMSEQYNSIGYQEWCFLMNLNRKLYENDITIIRCYNCFLHNNRVCLLLELYNYSISYILSHMSISPREDLPFDSTISLESSSFIQDKYRSISFIRRIAFSLFKSLSYIHSHGYIHADIKPENVLFDSTMETICLIDFSNCIPLSHVDLYNEPAKNEIQTPLYRAPEIVCGASPSPAIDIWSMGCLLYELYTKTPLLHQSLHPTDIQSFIDLFGSFPNSVYQKYPLYKQYINTNNNENNPEEQYDITSYLTIYASVSDYDSTFSSFSDLLSRCLDLNPNTRITAQQALYHPFFASLYPSKQVISPAIQQMIIKQEEEERKQQETQIGPQINTFYQFIQECNHALYKTTLTNLLLSFRSCISVDTNKLKGLQSQFYSIQTSSEITSNLQYNRMKNTLKDAEYTLSQINTLYTQCYTQICDPLQDQHNITDNINNFLYQKSNPSIVSPSISRPISTLNTSYPSSSSSSPSKVIETELIKEEKHQNITTSSSLHSSSLSPPLSPSLSFSLSPSLSPSLSSPPPSSSSCPSTTVNTETSSSFPQYINLSNAKTNTILLSPSRETHTNIIIKKELSPIKDTSSLLHVSTTIKREFISKEDSKKPKIGPELNQLNSLINTLPVSEPVLPIDFSDNDGSDVDLDFL
ncbi:hypothetical protein WA158_007234 [Blastocystis sp. Blastoise]